MNYDELKLIFRNISNIEIEKDILRIISDAEKSGISAIDTFYKLSHLYNNKLIFYCSEDEWEFLKEK